MVEDLGLVAQVCQLFIDLGSVLILFFLPLHFYIVDVITVESIRKVVETALVPVTHALSFVVSESMNPWARIRTESSSSVSDTGSRRLGTTVEEFYNIKHNVCMVAGKVMKKWIHDPVVSAHIWPKHTKGAGLDSLGLKGEDLHSARNILRLHKAIEYAFDHMWIMLEEESFKEDCLIMKVVLLNKSFNADLVAKWPIVAVTGRKGHRVEHPKTLRDFDGASLHWKFRGDRKPFLRLLSMHSIRAIKCAQQNGWIEGSDSSARLENAGALAAHSLDDEARFRISLLIGK
jgi:hypothetical protein